MNSNKLGLCKLCYVFSKSFKAEDTAKICDSCAKKIKEAELRSPKYG